MAMYIKSSTSALLHPSHHFNTRNAHVVGTNGARVQEDTISDIYYKDKAAPLGLIIVMGHAGCTQLTSAPDDTIRTDIQALKASPHIRKDLMIVGYVVDLYSDFQGGPATKARLREVTVPNTTSSASTSTSASASGQQSTANQGDSMSPFWS